MYCQSWVKYYIVKHLLLKLKTYSLPDTVYMNSPPPLTWKTYTRNLSKHFRYTLYNVQTWPQAAQHDRQRDGQPVIPEIKETITIYTRETDYRQGSEPRTYRIASKTVTKTPRPQKYSLTILNTRPRYEPRTPLTRSTRADHWIFGTVRVSLKPRLWQHCFTLEQQAV